MPGKIALVDETKIGCKGLPLCADVMIPNCQPETARLLWNGNE
jgi:hypothetical protein